MAVEKNYLSELFKFRGFEIPTNSEPMIGTGLVPMSGNDTQAPGDEPTYGNQDTDGSRSLRAPALPRARVRNSRSSARVMPT